MALHRGKYRALASVIKESVPGLAGVVSKRCSSCGSFRAGLSETLGDGPTTIETRESDGDAQTDRMHVRRRDAPSRSRPTSGVRDATTVRRIAGSGNELPRPTPAGPVPATAAGTRAQRLQP